MNAEGVFNVFFDEDGPGASSSLVGTATTLSFSGLASKAGGLPTNLGRGIAAGAFGPFPFFLLEAKGSSLGFFRMTLDLLSSSSSSRVGTTVASFESVFSRSRFFPSILFLSFSSLGPDCTCFSGSSAPTPKLDRHQIVRCKCTEEKIFTVEDAASLLRVPFRGLSWVPQVFSWALTR